jgi:hypothetical protein
VDGGDDNKRHSDVIATERVHFGLRCYWRSLPDIIVYYRQIRCGTISFVHQHFYHVARLVYISVSWLGRTVATESSDAAASRRLRHHDSGVVPPAGATPYCPAAPSHVCLQPIFGRMPGRRPLSMAPAVATHFRHCDVLTLNSSAAQVLPNGSARSRSRPRRAACWPSPGRPARSQHCAGRSGRRRAWNVHGRIRDGRARG